jgi:hypothetical protein
MGARTGAGVVETETGQSESMSWRLASRFVRKEMSCVTGVGAQYC